MKRYLLITILSAILIGVACTRDDFADAQDYVPGSNTGLPLENEDYIKPGVIQIKLSPEAEARFNPVITRSGIISTGVASIDALSEQLGVTDISRTFDHGGKCEGAMRKAGLHLWYNVYFDSSKGGTMTRAFSDFSSLPDLDFVEPVLRIKRIEGEITPITESELSNLMGSTRNGDLPVVGSGFNDPYIGYQWHYHNEGTLYQTKPGADINLYEAWKIETGKPQVIVAIIDGGIDTDHPDLKPNLWINEDEMNGADGQDDDNNGYTDDIHGFNFVTNKGKITPHTHGTHVAGTVGAVNNNGIGVAGVAGGDGTPESGIRLMSCQIFHTNEKNEEQSVKDEDRGKAFIYAANNGAVIAQNSWEYAWNGTEGQLMQSDKDAIDYFIARAGLDESDNQIGPMKGGIVIFATGNSDLNAKVLPSSYEKVFSVSSFGPDYRKAAYSNYGDWVHVSAPGGRGEYADGKMVFSTFTLGMYGYMEGTSMACPHVSGIAALVVSKYGLNPDGSIKPGFTNEQLKDRLLNATNQTVRWFNPVAHPIGKGYINAHKALCETGEIPPDRLGDISVKWTFEKAIVTWRVTIDSDDASGKADRYKLVVSEKDLYGLDFSQLPVEFSPITVSTMGKSAGDVLSHEFTGLEMDKTYYVSIAGFDTDGNISLSSTVKGQLIPNRGPVASDVPSSVMLRKTETKGYDIPVADPEGYSWTHEFESGSAAATASRTGDIIRLDFDANLVSPGSYTAVLTLADAQGVETRINIPYSVVFFAPNLLKGFEDLMFQTIGSKKEYALDDHFYDQDGDAMTFSAVSSNSSTATAIVGAGNKLTVTTTGFGTAIVTVTAADVDTFTEASFTVTCRDGAQSVDLYPVPVKKDGILNIRMGADVNGAVDVNIYSMSGARVFRKELIMSGGAAQSVDISSLGTGNYRVVVRYKNEEITRNITKL